MLSLFLGTLSRWGGKDTPQQAQHSIWSGNHPAKIPEPTLVEPIWTTSPSQNQSFWLGGWNIGNWGVRWRVSYSWTIWSASEGGAVPKREFRMLGRRMPSGQKHRWSTVDHGNVCVSASSPMAAIMQEFSKCLWNDLMNDERKNMLGTNLLILSITSHTRTAKKVLLFPFCSCKHWGLESLSDLSKTTEWKEGELGFKPSGSLWSACATFSTPHCLCLPNSQPGKREFEHIPLLGAATK